MNREEFERRLGEMRNSPGGPFFSYALNLDHTITPLRYLAVFFNRLLGTIQDHFPDKKIKKLRILDLGSYEGVYSVPLAQMGAEVVSVEGKEVNYKKLELARDFLGLKNLTTLLADVRNLDVKKLGEFDAVLSCGLMYHLDAPGVFEVTEKIYAMTKRVAIFDTHIALARPLTYVYKGKTYHGSSHREFDPGTSSERKKLSLAHSLDNEESFWLTRVSWLNFLKDVGFQSVYEALMPFAEREMGFYDRMTFVATKREGTAPFFPEELGALPEQIGSNVPVCQDVIITPNDQGLTIR